MLRKTVSIGFAALVGLAAATGASADEWDKKSVLTFSQRFEIPGHVLPAGTYTFKLADSLSDRHIVQVYNADGSKLIATFMTVPDYRLQATSDTVIRFNEVPEGAPEAIRAWFYPGNTVGQEFVYPKKRAAELAVTTRTIVPAVAVETATVEGLRTAPIVALTPERIEAPVSAVIQTRPTARAPGSAPRAVQARTSLPKTASLLPLLIVLGFSSLIVALGLVTVAKKRTLAPARAPIR
jgi:hypothetical protein